MCADIQVKKVLKSKDNCEVCGRLLVYQAEPVSMGCVFCRQAFSTNMYCAEGHYICDTCRQCEALDTLRQVLSSSISTSPTEILETVMSHPSVPMHGAEHHAMVPAAIVAAVHNAGYPVPQKAIEQAITRGTKVPGGWCGFHGACGAAIGVGIAISILTEATPLTGKQRSLAMEATSFALHRMVDGHPRCCKRTSRKALEAAVEFLRDKIDIIIDNTRTIACNYPERNKECPRENCPYYSSDSS